MDEMKNDIGNDKPQVKSNVNIKFTLKLQLWNSFDIISAPNEAVQALLVIISSAFFFQPILSTLGLSHVELLSVLIPFSMFAFSSFNVVYAERYNNKGKKIYSGVNLGGAVIPLALASYLLLTTAKVWLFQELVVMLVAIFFGYGLSMITEKGIIGLTPIVSLVTSLATLFLVHDANVVPIVAYSSSVIGNFIGADVMKIKKILEIAQTNDSLGGQGITDGINMAGLYSLAIVYFALDVVLRFL